MAKKTVIKQHSPVGRWVRRRLNNIKKEVNKDIEEGFRLTVDDHNLCLGERIKM